MSRLGSSVHAEIELNKFDGIMYIVQRPPDHG